MRRGFKTQAEQISLQLRKELGLTASDRLDCTALAAHLAIDVAPVTDLLGHGASAADVNRLVADDGGFSAMTVYRGTRCRIFFNPFHPPTRNANSIAHEISHVVLEHEPAAFTDCDGLRDWNAEQEDEAAWLAGALLVPREGAFRWMLAGGSQTAGAEHFGVSAQLFTWRVNHTGVAAQLRRRAGR